MSVTMKDWDHHVDHAELIARSAGFQRLRELIVDLARPQPQDVVVDIGAGTGLLSLDLAPLVQEVWAIDIAPAMVEYLQALSEIHRILRPGGRLVFGDMMFGLDVSDTRDRAVINDKVRAMLRRGPAGILRLAKNGARIATGTWERPARATWWTSALAEAGFVDVDVRVLDHEGGIASARRPTR